MTIQRRQEDCIDIIKDSKVKEVFETCAKLEDASDKVEWRIRLIHADSFSKDDPCEAEDYTEEEYMFDNQRFVEFLNKYYGATKKVTFQNSPDFKRIYLNCEEVEVLGTTGFIVGEFGNSGKITITREVDYLTANIKNTGSDLDLYSQLVKKLPGYNWTLSNCGGLTVDTDNECFKELDSRIAPFFHDGEVIIREIVHLDCNLDSKKWMIFIENDALKCEGCGACCD